MARNLVDEACRNGARKAKACEELGISIRTLQRWSREGDVAEDGRKNAVRKRSTRALTDAERQAVLAVVNSKEYADYPPSQLVPILADQGIYLASESTIYRILREEKLQNHRGRTQLGGIKTVTSHEAKGPDEVWSWDISWIPGPITGLYYYLYLILDIFSRKIVGWEVWERESEHHAAELIRRAAISEKIGHRPLVLHSDNGSPMKGSTFQAQCRKLGIISSRSRPRVSNDNAYSEALFKTYKYRPAFPHRGFESLEAAREWTQGFVTWYNEEHHHSAIAFVTPGQRHRGEDEEILAARKAVYEEARAKNPRRWSRQIRRWVRPGSMWLNPEREPEQQQCQQENQQQA